MPAAVTKDKVMAKATKTVNVVECSACSAMHLAESNSYVVIYGNISIGLDQPVIEDNIDDKGKVAHSTIYCRKLECLKPLFQFMLGSTLPDAIDSEPGTE